jgi:uncharacterized membrane protein
MKGEGAHAFGRPLGLVLIAAYKGIWGMLEMLAGLLILFSYKILVGELAEDPQDLFARWVLSHASVTYTSTLEVGAVLIALGAIKVLIGIGVWYRSWAIRNLALAFFLLVAAYGLYDLWSHFTILKALAVVADLVIAWYFWKILPHHLGEKGVR